MKTISTPASLASGITLAVALAAACMPARVAAQSPEELILTAVLAQELAEEALHDVVTPLGAVLTGIGSGAAYATDRTGFGQWSIALGATGAGLQLATPDLNEDDPEDEEIQAAVGAVFADASLGLFRGYSTSGRVQDIFSIDLLGRLGYSVGDQDDLAESIDFSSVKHILGGGFRIGLLRGPGLPAVSLSIGANHFAERRLSVRGTVEEDGDVFPYSVDLDVRQTSGFAVLEVGKAFGPIALFGTGGFARHRMEAVYRSGIVFDTSTSAENVTVTIGDELDIYESRGLAGGGVELGGRVFRVNLTGGTMGSEPYGSFFLRVVG